MCSAPVYLIFLLLIPTLGLALPHRLRDEELASGETLSGRAFTLPIHRRRVPTRHSRRDGASGSVGLGDNFDLLYTVSIQVGNTTTTVNLDTGSSDLWVISSICTTALCNQSTATRVDAVSPTSSSTNVTMNYGDSTTGTYASGPVGNATVTIAGLAVTDQQYAAIVNTTSSAVSFGAAGILGVGFPGGSLIQRSVVNQQYHNPPTTDQFVASIPENGPLLSRVVSSGDLVDPMFALTLQRDTIDIDGTGQLTIGKLPDGVQNSSLTWVPVRLYSPNDGGLTPPKFAPNETFPYRWEIPLDAVYLDGQKLADSTIPGRGINSPSLSALIDTGNSAIRGPKDVVENILGTVSPSYASSIASNSNAQPTFPCSMPHSLAFQIGGQMFPVDPRDFVGAGNDTSTCVADHVVPTDPPSKGALYSWSLGDPFFKSNLIAFHYGNLTHPSVDPPRMGFLSTVPRNAAQLLDQAVTGAQRTGKLEATTQLAPTASASAPATTLSISSIPIPSVTITSASRTKNSAVSFRCGSPGIWGTALVASCLTLLSWI